MNMKWLIPVICFILACLSLLTLRSIAPELVVRQFVYFLLGSGLFYFLSTYRFKSFHKPAVIAYWLLIFVLLLLLIVGRETRQTVRWIDLFAGFKIQPSQFAVVITSLFLAFKLPQIKVDKWPGLLKLIGIIGFPALLIFLQPDLSSSLVFLVSFGVILFLIPIKFKQIVIMGLGFLMVLSILWAVVLRPYQKIRMTSFFSASETQDMDAGYNARQALIAVGSGQFYGRGLGFGIQSHLRFLPERQTDFVFASIAEEWGFVGSFILVSLYFALILVILYFSFKVENLPQQLYLLILVVALFLQVFINIGMNLGLLPITGITLPLISYGGSSVISFLIAFGIAFNIISNQKTRYKLWIK